MSKNEQKCGVCHKISTNGHLCFSCEKHFAKEAIKGLKKMDKFIRQSGNTEKRENDESE